MDAGTLGFMADGQWLGTAFSGLQGLTLYPVVSCVWGHCEVTMRYLNGLGPWPLTLKEQARRCIRANTRQRIDTPFNNLRELPLPPSLKKYIMTQGVKHYIRHQVKYRFMPLSVTFRTTTTTSTWRTTPRARRRTQTTTRHRAGRRAACH